jgi:hypothetical protein
MKLNDLIGVPKQAKQTAVCGARIHLEGWENERGKTA